MDINWGSVADWVSGTATFFAAIVALYLAHNAEKIKLKGYCGLRVIVGNGVPKIDVVTFSVTNLGTRTTVVNNIGIQVGKRNKKRFAIINIVKDTYSMGLPCTLSDGQIAHWYIQLDAERSWFKDICEDFIDSKEAVDTLRFSFQTNHGNELLIEPEQNLKKAFIETINNKKSLTS